MTVRSAQETDFGRVTELLEALGRARVTHDSYALARQVYLDQLEDPNAAHLVAIDNGSVAGFCSLHFRTRLNHTTPAGVDPRPVRRPFYPRDAARRSRCSSRPSGWRASAAATSSRWNRTTTAARRTCSTAPPGCRTPGNSSGSPCSVDSRDQVHRLQAPARAGARRAGGAGGRPDRARPLHGHDAGGPGAQAARRLHVGGGQRALLARAGALLRRGGRPRRSTAASCAPRWPTSTPCPAATATSPRRSAGRPVTSSPPTAPASTRSAMPCATSSPARRCTRSC